MSRLVAGRRSPEVPAASPVERLPGLLRCLRIVSHWAGFFQGTGPPSGCRCPNTRRLGLRSGAKCPGACHGIRPGASGALWRGCCPSCIVPLSHRKVWGLPIVLPGGAAGVTSRTSGIRRSGAGCQVTGRTRAITRAGEGPSRGDIVPAVGSCHRIHLSRQYSIVRVKASPRNGSRSSVKYPCSRAINLNRLPLFPGSAPP
jgi:hypothetical protein